MVIRQILVVVMLMTTAATAQPSLSPIQPPPAIPTAEEREILANGTVSGGRYAGGAVASLFLGFGSGQAIQGRWRDTGWVFTFGEVAAYSALIYGVSKGGLGACDPEPCHRNRAASELAIGGLITFMILHTWEIGDALIAPSLQNDHYHRVSGRYALSPYVAPHGDGAVAGLGVSF